jgi:hypothetical protein
VSFWLEYQMRDELRISIESLNALDDIAMVHFEKFVAYSDFTSLELGTCW